MRLTTGLSRRNFLRNGACAFLGPWVIPSGLLGATAPSRRITIGCIGVGRMGVGDLVDMMGRPEAQIVAVCDVDRRRLENARALVERYYSQRAIAGNWRGCAVYHDFRELLARPDIDAVQIATPDHWHAIPAVQAARAGKDIFIQKPLTYTIEEGRILSDTVRRYGRVLQVGSQQRSESNFRFACELVRNGRIGRLKTVLVGLPIDPAGGVPGPMPVPEWLDYDFWLGPAPWVPYAEDRVHPPNVNDRPGWLRLTDYCLGMITGWGAHHNDIAQWGLGTELTGPVEIEGTAEYPDHGLWDVHGLFRVEYAYADGTRLICADSQKYPVGVRFEGSEGWVFVTRGAIDAQPRSLLRSTIGPGEIHLYRSTHHKQNFLDCVRSRQEPIAPVEVAHRSCTVCILGYIAMKLRRRLKWNPLLERFENDEQANRMLCRPMRQPWRL